MSEDKVSLFGVSITLSNNLKMFVVLLFTIMPFWYLNIFLFKKDFIVNNDIQIPIILSFCLSITYSFLNFLIAFFISGLTKNNGNLSGYLLVTAIISTFILSVFMFVNHLIKLKFLWFTIIVFSFSFVSFAILAIYAWIKKL